MKTLKRLICWVRGHDFPTPAFHGNALCFCHRCDMEVAGRTFADLEPMTCAEHDQFLLLDMLD
jgi:hypothetical protein